MEKSIVTTGKTIELAIETALTQLGLDRDSVSVMVLSQAKAGFLGLGAQPAKVQVTYEAPDPIPEAPKAALSSASRSKPKAAIPVKKPEAPKAGLPKQETPKSEAPKAESPKAEPVKPQKAIPINFQHRAIQSIAVSQQDLSFHYCLLRSTNYDLQGRCYFFIADSASSRVT